MINDINQQTMTKSVFLSILLWIFIYPLRVRAIESINFIHIGVNEGLSQNTVFDITQDKQGNMWFATYDGLNKYDGYDFTIYRHNESDPHSIGSVIVRACITDTQGRIWAGTEEGLSLYDTEQDRFQNFRYSKNKKTLAINGIIEINEKQLLLYTNQNENLLTFDTETHCFSDNPLHPSLLNILPTAIAKQDNHIYIGSYKGVFSYSISDKTLKSIMPDKLKGKQILSILQQSPILLWIGTEGHGLYKVIYRLRK